MVPALEVNCGAGNRSSAGLPPNFTKRPPAKTDCDFQRWSWTAFIHWMAKDKNGTVIEYGNKYITYKAPSSKLKTLGQALYMENCASCHGTEAAGVPANGTTGAYPNLVGLGPATWRLRWAS